MNQLDEPKDDFQIDPMDIVVGLAFAIGLPVLMYVIVASFGFSPKGKLVSSAENMAQNESQKTNSTFMSLEEGEYRLELVNFILDDRVPAYLTAQETLTDRTLQERDSYWQCAKTALIKAESYLNEMKSEIERFRLKAPIAELESKIDSRLSKIAQQRKRNDDIQHTY